jgi:hypothetical protein
MVVIMIYVPLLVVFRKNYSTFQLIRFLIIAVLPLSLDVNVVALIISLPLTVFITLVVGKNSIVIVVIEVTSIKIQ